MYYRIAVQKQSSTEWEWKSTLLHSLEEVFRLSQQYTEIPATHLRIFAASTSEYMDTLLVRENLGLTSNSLTLEQILHDHQSLTIPHIRQFEAQLGWGEEEAHDTHGTDVPGQEMAAPATEAEPLPVATLDRSIDDDFITDPEPYGSDHDQPYTFAFPEYTPHALAWLKLRAKVQAGELEP